MQIYKYNKTFATNKTTSNINKYTIKNKKIKICDKNFEGILVHFSKLCDTIKLS